MKRSIQLLTAVLGFALGGASVQAALSYWDSNGTTNGAGDAPNGIWDPAEPPYFWSEDAAGASATSAWAEGDTAVFSAGADATNAFTVTINGMPQAGGLTFEEGEVTLSGGGITMTNEFEFPIIALTNAFIDSSLGDYFGTCGIKKTGPGTLTLRGYNYFGPVGCTNTIAEGALVYTTGGGLGSTPLVTIVSNGASLQQVGPLSVLYPVILNGTGVTNSGALRASHDSSVDCRWYGGAQLHSDARIVNNLKGAWRWEGTYNIEGTNGGNFNLTLGGNGGTMRLNMALPYNRAVNLGTGVLIKEGTFMLQLENPSICSAFYLNGGSVYPRYPGFGSGTIYVGTDPGIEFRALFQDCSTPEPISLAQGANPGFDCRLYNGNYLQYTCSGVISGLGGLYKTNPGSLFLTAANTYSGKTTVKGGTLVLGANGSIANSALIEIWSLGAFDVSAVTGSFVLGPAQTLMGEGTVVGNVTANGTISPGASIGNLTFNNDLTIAGNLSIEVDRGIPSSDLVTVSGLLTNAGAGGVLVTSVGAALQPGDNFTIFSQPVLNGQAMAVVGGGVVWTNELASNGRITVLSASPVPATDLSAQVTGPTSALISGMGTPNTAYAIFASTDVTAPMASWSLIGTALADGSGVIQFTDTQATEPEKFYRFGQ